MNTPLHLDLLETMSVEKLQELSILNGFKNGEVRTWQGYEITQAHVLTAKAELARLEKMGLLATPKPFRSFLSRIFAPQR